MRAPMILAVENLSTPDRRIVHDVDLPALVPASAAGHGFPVLLGGFRSIERIVAEGVTPTVGECAFYITGRPTFSTHRFVGWYPAIEVANADIVEEDGHWMIGPAKLTQVTLMPPLSFGSPPWPGIEIQR